jgi:hypothetical protein
MLIPEGFAQINFIFSGNGVPTAAEMTMGCEIGDEDFTPASLAEVAAHTFEDTILTIIDSQVGLASVHCKFGPNDVGGFGDFISGEGGGLGVAMTVPQCAVLISKQTAFGGRSGRGRFYMPGVTEADTDGSGLLGEDYRDAVQAEFDTFLDFTVSQLWPMVLLHGEDSPATEPYPVTSLAVQERTATQRRRNRS